MAKVKWAKHMAKLLKIPEHELLCLCEGLECMGVPQVREAEDGEKYWHEDEWDVFERAIIKGNLLNWPDEFTPPGRAPKEPEL